MVNARALSTMKAGFGAICGNKEGEGSETGGGDVDSVAGLVLCALLYPRDNGNQ